MPAIQQSNYNSQMAEFFKTAPIKEKKRQHTTSLLNLALKNVKHNVVDITTRTVRRIFHGPEIVEEPKPVIIRLSEDIELRLPAYMPHEGHHACITALEHYINTIHTTPLFSTPEQKQALDDFFSVIKGKIDSYIEMEDNEKSNEYEMEIISVMNEAVASLYGFTCQAGDKEKPEVLTQLIHCKTLLMYGHPESADKYILGAFLELENLPERFKSDAIYSHFKSEILSNTENFNNGIKSQTSFATRYTFGLPKLSAFFKSINFDISTDKHSSTKVVRRFDEFIEKVNDLFIRTYNIMHNNEVVFSDLSDYEQLEIIKCSAKLATVLSEKGVLLEGAEFSHLKTTFDNAFGGIFNSLNELTDSEHTRSKEKRKNNKMHLSIIADGVINRLYNLPDIFDEAIKNAKTPISEKKVFVSEVISTSERKISEEILSQLDDQIINLDKHFISTDKLMSLPIEDQQRKLDEWKAAAKEVMTNLDTQVEDTREKSDDSRSIFIKKFLLRKAILNGFGLIISTLDKELGENRDFIFDNCIARIINQTTLEFNKASESPPITEDKLALIFKRVVSSISVHTHEAQIAFAKSLVDCYKEHSSKMTTAQPSPEPLPNSALSNMRQVKKEHLYTSVSVDVRCQPKTVLQSLEETKNLLGTMLCAYSDESVTVTDQRSLVERLAGEKTSAPKDPPKYATDIHRLTEADISAKTHENPRWPSVRKELDKVSDTVSRPEISRHKSNLSPSENIRKKHYIMMKESDHNNLRTLCQYALQKIKLKMESKIPAASYTKLCVYIDHQIENISKIEDTHNLTPSKWLKNTINRIFSPPSDSMLKLNDDLDDQSTKLLNDHNVFLKKNYNMGNQLTWDQYLKSYQDQDNYRTFEQTIKNSKIPDNDKQTITSLFKVYEECFTDIFQSPLSRKLPPSSQTISMHQKISAFRLGFSENSTSEPEKSHEYYEKFRLGIINYNDHLKSLSEQVASKLFKTPDRHAQRLNQLDDTFKKSRMILQNDALKEMISQFDSASSNGDIQELLRDVNEHLDKLFQLGFFEKYFGKKSYAFKSLKTITKRCYESWAFIPGAFVAAAVVNMLFTAPGTNLLRALQKDAPEVYNSIIALKSIFQLMEGTMPNLSENARILYSAPFNGTSFASNCSANVYRNLARPGNVSFAGAMNSAEGKTISLLRSLNYKDAQNCPTGGLDSFPPGSFINWPNLLTTVVSISSGAIACFHGWAQDVDSYVEGVKEYSALPNIFQDFSPEVTEKLLLQSARQLPGREDDDTIYAGPESAGEYCLEAVDTLFNKTVKYTSRTSPQYCLNWSTWVLRYMTCGACSMAVPKRPHSLEDLRDRVFVAAADRKFKTLIRMLGYNTAKEFIDVFSTKSGTLAFLLFLKEADFFEAVNEKAGIADYQVMKAMHDLFIKTLDTLAKHPGRLNQHQINLLKSTYGTELIDDLLGPDASDADIAAVEKAAQTKLNAWCHRAAGMASLTAAFSAQCFNLSNYTYKPWVIANQTIAKLKGQTVNLSDDVFEKIRTAAEKTIKREYTPYNLSYDQQFWHYIFAERSGTKFQQSFLLWGIKELINLSMYFNATAHERAMGNNTVNWELLGCLVAYLVKDSTGMCARFATLLDNESLRTFFSLLDKLDSPLAEKVLSEIGRRGLHSPQSVVNTVDSMMEEVIENSTGDIRDIHHRANIKCREMERIGMTTLKKTSEILEKQTQETINSMAWPEVQKATQHGSPHRYDDAVQFSDIQGNLSSATDLESGLPEDTTSSTGVNKGLHLPSLLSTFRNQLQANMVSHGMPVDDKTRETIRRLDEFMRTKACGADYRDPLVFLKICHELEAVVPINVIEALCCLKVIKPIRSLDPLQKHNMRLKALNNVSSPKEGHYGYETQRGHSSTSSTPVTRQPGNTSSNTGYQLVNMDVDYV